MSETISVEEARGIVAQDEEERERQRLEKREEERQRLAARIAVRKNAAQIICESLIETIIEQTELLRQAVSYRPEEGFTPNPEPSNQRIATIEKLLERLRAAINERTK